jgi:pimeloyl-ACP methyl ester carboxylesterase
MPTLLLWGSDDMIVPVEHARLAHEAMPGSRLEVFDGAGHFPFHTHAPEVLAALRTFLADTAPARWSAAEWRELLRHGRSAHG